MELLDRYLQAVKRHLPWQRQDDIIAELRANLEAQLEDKEAELGRKLSDAEMEAWLKQMGSPLHVAARYQPQRYLIGPGLFPIYWYVLRLALVWCAVIYAVANGIRIIMSGLGADAIFGAVLHLPMVMFVNSAIVTLIFVVIEWSGAQIPGKVQIMAGIVPPWPAGPLPAQATGCGKRRTYAHAVAEVIFGWLFLIWLLLVPHHPFLLWGPGVYYFNSLPYQLAPVWWTWYWWIVALNAIELVWHMVDLFTGTWQRPQRALHFVKSAIGLIGLSVLLTAPGHALFLAKNTAADARTLTLVNQNTYRAFQIVVAIIVLRLIWEVGKMGVEAYRKRQAAAQ